MEYCDNSLASIIELPENAFGLQESEFLIVLKDLSMFVVYA